MKHETKVLVIGGGMTGLCAAYYLARQVGEEALMLIEAEPAVGGTSRTDYEDGFTCEWGPNGFLDKEPLTLRWAEDLGITTEIQRSDEASAHRFLYRNGRLHEIKGPPAFFFSPLLSRRARARLLCEPFVRGKRDDSPETIWDFAARRIGREAADILVSSMVSGVYGGDAKKLSLAHCFPQMAAMEREYGSLTRALFSKKRSNKAASAAGPSGTLTSFNKGIGFLPEAAAQQLNRCIRTGVGATRVRRIKDAYEITTTTGDTIAARAVVVAVPAFTAAAMTEGLDQHLPAALKGIPYAGLSVICAGYRRDDVGHDLDGFGFLAPRTEDLRALGCIWTSTIFPGRAPVDWVMLRVMYGGSTDPDAVTLDDSELVACLEKDIHPLLDICRRPEFLRVYRHKRGIPQYHLGHGVRLKSIEAAEAHNPGLVFAGNAYRGVSLNDCVVSAHRAVEKVMKAIEPS